MWGISLSLAIALAMLHMSCSKHPAPLNSRRHHLMRTLHEINEESKDASLESRVQRLIQEQPLISVQLAATLFAYTSILLTSIVKLPSQTRTLVRLQSGIAIACSKFAELISKIQSNDLPSEISNDPMVLKQFLSAVVASRVGQLFVLSCMSLILAGDKYSVLPVLIRGFPELLQLTLFGLCLVVPSFEISPQIVDIIFESQNISSLNELTNSTTNFSLQNTGIIGACCDIVSLPLEVSLLPKSLANLRSKKFAIILLNMCFLYVFLHYLSKRLAEIRFSIESIPENFGRTVISSLRNSELFRGIAKGKAASKKKAVAKKKRKSDS